MQTLIRKLLSFLFFLPLLLQAGEGMTAGEPSIRRTATVRAVAGVLPSVVNIGTERIINRPYSPWSNDPFERMFRDFFAEQGQVKTTSLGSGVIISSDGLLVTNAHVVARAAKISVSFADGRQYTAHELASDELNDIALLQLDGLNANSNLTPIRFAGIGDLLLGETVVAVGNPYGLGHSISRGVLSAMGRKASYRGNVIFADILQTDTAINPGNSGGPLINLDGDMLGINTAIHREGQGIGFAIPLSRLERLLATWLIPERFREVSLGFIPGIEDSGDGRMAITVVDIIPGSPAAEAELRVGDQIAACNGQPLDRLFSLSIILWKLSAGDILTLTLSDGAVRRLKVEKLKFADGREEAARRLGLKLQRLTPQLAKAMQYPFEEGLILSEIPEASDGLRRGDVLIRLGDVPVRDFPDISRALKGQYFGDKIDALFIQILNRAGQLYLVKRRENLHVK